MKQRVFCGLSLTIALACSSGSPRGGGGTGGEEETGGGGGSATGGSKATGGKSGGDTGGAGGSGTGGAMSTGGASGGAGGEGGSTGGAGGSMGGAGGAAGAGGMAGGGGGEPAAALNMFLFDVPCPTPTTAGNCQIPTEMRKKMKMVQFGGDPAKTYQVKLHFCGPVEGQKFANCKPNPIPMQDSHVCIDGTPSTSPSYMANYPAYSMAVTEPKATYFLNNGWVSDDLVKIDYSASFNIKGGTSIIFQSDGGANTDTYTARLKNHNFMCPGVPMIMQPFAGQFIYVTVESVTAM